jgi:hypothetical protein
MSEIIKVLEWTIRCVACNGTGQWPTLKNPEGKHFACNGTGLVKISQMTPKQINFIRGLFNELVRMDVIAEGDGLWNSVVTKMRNHKDAVAVEDIDNMLTIKDASDIIEMLKDHKSRALKIQRELSFDLDRFHVAFDDNR